MRLVTEVFLARVSPLTNKKSTSAGFRFSRRVNLSIDQPISFLMAYAVGNPDLISLAAGLVDYQSLPIEETGKLVGELLAEPRAGQVALQYGTTRGLRELREVLLEHMARLDGLEPQDLGADPDHVVVTSGSQQLLFIITDVLVDPGDIVITEWPSYFVYLAALKSFGAEVRAVEIDEQGMVPEQLERLLSELQASGDLHRVKILYTSDYHQNPTGITLSADRRPKILDIVRCYSRDHRILILEDAAYRELTYDGQGPASIRSHDPDNQHVVLAQTFSKPFSPGLRTGYGLLPGDLVEPVLSQKGNHDFGSANFLQHLLLAAMTKGVYDQHVDQLRRTYAAKCDAMLEALQHHLGRYAGDQMRWTIPSGGMYVYLSLPLNIDTGRQGTLFQRALDRHVLYVPGEFCYCPDPTRTVPRHHIRLSFGEVTIEQIGEGIARLAEGIREVMG